LLLRFCCFVIALLLVIASMCALPGPQPATGVSLLH
jgi:hypothetical protein